MAIFALSSTAPPPKARLISAPMHARHVGGVSITGGTGGNTSLASYFAPSSLEPDELPSHTYAASGLIEVPRRSNTFTNAVRRPSLNLKRSLSRLRSSSGHKRSVSDNRVVRGGERGDGGVSYSGQGNMEVLPSGPKMSLDWDIHTSESTSKSTQADPLPIPPPKDLPKAPPTTASPPLPVRPHRADSGTAIVFANLPEDERPLGFKEIAAKSNFEERMALYIKTREYWASAEHGLGEWTGRTGGR